MTVELLTRQQLVTLSRLADELIPRSDTMPSATDVDIASQVVQRVLRVRDDLVDVLARLLDRAAAEDATAAVERLRQEDQDGLLVLKLVVGGGYLMHPRVGELLGYRGQEAKIVNKDEYIEYVSAGLLDPVMARGPVYREVPPRA